MMVEKLPAPPVRPHIVFGGIDDVLENSTRQHSSRYALKDAQSRKAAITQR